MARSTASKAGQGWPVIPESVPAIVLVMGLAWMVSAFAKRAGAGLFVKLAAALKHAHTTVSVNTESANARRASGVMTVPKSFVRDLALATVPVSIKYYGNGFLAIGLCR